MQKIVVLSGAGISAESGIRTFRDANGLWENHDIMEVASPQGWAQNPALVLEFYNKRRAQLHTVQPNAAHTALVKLEKQFQLQVITQNVDDLHERAGASQVLHLHGELLKARSTQDPNCIIDWTTDISLEDTAPDGQPLRPHIVWFGEEVPCLPQAAEHCAQADIVLIIGTSMQVYPAASLIEYAPATAQKYYIDPHPAPIHGIPNLHVLQEKASIAVPKLVDQLLQNTTN